jgi:tetratricopeptide (TPR) repeat protein
MRITQITILALALFTLVSCQSEQSVELAELQALEASIADGSATESQLNELSEKYLQYLEKYPEDHDANSAHLYTLAMIEFQGDRFTAAITLLKQALRDHFVPERAAAQLQFIATIYRDHLNNPMMGNVAYKTFAMGFPDHSKAQIIQDSLLSDVPTISDQLDTIRTQLYNEELGRIDFAKANAFIDVSELHALGTPNGANTPALISEAAKVAGYINAHERALELYSWVYSTYPTHEKAGQALFMMGFIQDNNLEDKAAAKEHYEEFLEKYPNDEFAEHARFLLDNLDKSNEEIIEGFERGQE